MPRTTLTQKVERLLALSHSPNVNEAKLALDKAHVLIARHKLYVVNGKVVPRGPTAPPPPPPLRRRSDDGWVWVGDAWRPPWAPYRTYKDDPRYNGKDNDSPFGERRSSSSNKPAKVVYGCGDRRCVVCGPVMAANASSYGGVGFNR